MNINELAARLGELKEKGYGEYIVEVIDDENHSTWECTVIKLGKDCIVLEGEHFGNTKGV